MVWTEKSILFQYTVPLLHNEEVIHTSMCGLLTVVIKHQRDNHESRLTCRKCVCYTYVVFSWKLFLFLLFLFYVLYDILHCKCTREHRYIYIVRYKCSILQLYLWNLDLLKYCYSLFGHHIVCQKKQPFLDLHWLIKTEATFWHSKWNFRRECETKHYRPTP